MALKQRIDIRSLVPDDLSKIIDLQARYAVRYPDSNILPGNTYRSPGFSDSGEIFCAFDLAEKLVGYASVYPAPVLEGPASLPHILWAEAKLDPGIGDQEETLEALLDHLLDHARALVCRYPHRSTQLIFQNFPFEVETIQFLHQRGFVHTESIYQLGRDLSLPVEPVLAPPSMQAVPWRMQTEQEQRIYIQGRNQVFPEASITLDDWKCFMLSPLWEVGTCLAIFDGEELAGSMLLYWDEEQNRLSGHPVGFTEYIFVLPSWRGLGLGTYLVTQGLLFLKKHGLKEAQLEVKAANVGALGLYTRLGYQVKRESWFLETTL